MSDQDMGGGGVQSIMDIAKEAKREITEAGGPYDVEFINTTTPSSASRQIDEDALSYAIIVSDLNRIITNSEDIKIIRKLFKTYEAAKGSRL